MLKIKKVPRHSLHVIIAVFGMAIIFNQFMAARAATDRVELYLNPASGSMNSGAGLSVKVFLEKNDSEDTQYVSAKVKFPANSLSVSSISTAGSFFAANANDPHRRATFNNNTGNLEIAGFNSAVSNMPAGTYLVGTINFIGKGFGSAAVNFESSSRASEEPGDNNELTGFRGATYTVTAPAPPPVLPPPASPPAPVSRPPASGGAAPQAGGAAPASSGGAPGAAAAANPGSAVPGAASASSPDGTGNETALTPISPDKPVITNVVISDVTSSTALINWETTPILRATFRYGTDPTDLGKEIQLGDVSNKMSVELKDLPAGKTIYYEIAEVQGDQATSYFGDFKTGDQTNALLVAGMIVGGLIIGGGLLGGGYLFYKRKQLYTAHTAKAMPVQSYEAPGKKVVPILAPKADFAPLTLETVAPPVVPVVVTPAHASVQPAAEVEVPKKTPEVIELPAQPFVPPAQLVPPTASGSMPQQFTPDPLPLEATPDIASHQPDEATTHWPWTAAPPEAGSQGTAAKSLEDDDIPDMYEVGQERLKEVEEHLHPPKH